MRHDTKFITSSSLQTFTDPLQILYTSDCLSHLEEPLILTDDLLDYSGQTGAYCYVHWVRSALIIPYHIRCNHNGKIASRHLVPVLHFTDLEEKSEQILNVAEIFHR